MRSNLQMMSLIFCALIPLSALGGPWISSGGDLKGDSVNPWFSVNTPVVNYCISIDKESVSASKRDVAEAFTKAVRFWTSEFRNNIWTQGSNASMLFAPLFAEKDCSDSIDLYIYLGQGSLNQKQKDFVNSITSHNIAMAVRTDYNSVSLKGQGFIYLNGDLNKPEWNVNAWSKKDRLTSVLTHELGHVMGVPHQQGDFAVMFDSGSGLGAFPVALNLMAETFPQAMVLQVHDFPVSLAFGITPVLSGSNVYDICNLNDSTKKWFEVSQEAKCIRLVLSPLINDENAPFAQVFTVNEKVEFIGTLQITSQDFLLSSRSDVITQIYLTKDQAVFQNITSANPYHAIGMQISAHLKLRYLPKSNSPSRPVILDFSPAQLTLMGIIDGEFVKILSKQTIRPLFK